MSMPLSIGVAASAASACRRSAMSWSCEILPRHRGHIGLFGRAQLQQIGASVGVDDEVGDEIGPRRLGQDVDALGRAGAALGVANHPSHGVAGGNRTRADKLLACLQGDVGDLARRCIDLIEGAVGKWVDLHALR